MNIDKSPRITTIIPTLNRLDLLRDTVETLINQSILPAELLLVDQSDHNKIKDWFQNLQAPFHKRYIHSNIKSLTAARNLGVKNAGYEIISYLDDDVLLDKDYYKGILEIFKTYPEAKGVGGYITNYHQGNRLFNKIKRLPRILFVLNYNHKNSCKLLYAYGTSYPDPLSKVINCQWLCGANTNWKREVFQEFQFDEVLSGYSFMEDVDFSYRVYKKYPHGLYLTPDARIIHRKSGDKKANRLGVRYIDHESAKYLFFKNFKNNPYNRIIYTIQKTGIKGLESIYNLLRKIE